MLQKGLRCEIILRHAVLQWYSSPELFLHGIISLHFIAGCGQPFNTADAKIGFFVKHVTAASVADMRKEKMEKGIGYFLETDHGWVGFGGIVERCSLTDGR